MPRQAQLHAVRETEGNTQKRPIPASVKLPAEAPAEPNWEEPFPKVPPPKHPGRLIAPPAKPKAGATDEEHAAYRLARLGWMLERSAHFEALRSYEEAKRLRDEATRCRRIAHETWASVVPLLDAQHVLALADAAALADHCVLQARLDQGERDLTRRGIWTDGERGAVKNPSATFVNQCREKDRPYLLDFGLTPAARDKLNPRKGDDDEEGLFG